MKVTIQNVLDKLMEPVPELARTVDILLTGNKETLVKGIATTFLATHDVIQQAIDLGVNLLITHEGLYYSHLDRTGKWTSDPVFLEKKRLIEQSEIAIFRFHDYIHMYEPDGITSGLIQRLNWETYIEKDYKAASILALPKMPLKEIVSYVKDKLQIPYVRVAGDLSLGCKRVGISVGYRGGNENSIPLFHQDKIDLLISGEGPEWETPEYVRDAVQQGLKKALIFLGHAESEKAGMEYIAQKIQTLFPSIPVHFIEEKPVFEIL
ncbi:Nif3-like dinuclear metal center hexameric protein [Lederbergia citri]|uniref:GTP cyclohydrolase 1 type 2 homolog n=1 Tax=Lederbergia citri TaxID=2833580 RepID=A0A942YF56_9BACI|nr:Nif3-like dinuclear metal center hexameric protein [Lederbergia citri]MBS4194132.1 Nif3-like dinuclear metal center hexameric protein [Lederbergia citri]